MLGAGGSPRQQRAESPLFLLSPTQIEGKGVYEGAADRMPVAIPEHSTAEAGSAGTWPWTPVRGLFSVARSRRI